MLQPPEFHFNSTSDRGTLHLRVRHNSHGFEESLALHGEVTFEMDVGAHLIHTASGKLSVQVESVDTRSLKVDYSSVTGIFKGMVHSKILKQLQSEALDLHNKPKVIVDALPFPTQIGGIPIKVLDFRADPNGYLVLYAEFDLSR